MTDQELFSQIFEQVKSLGGIPWTLKVATVVMMLISLTKVSFIRPLWDKLGWVKGLVAPVLGIVAGILLLSKDGALTLSGVLAYAFAGAGAIVLHELLDGVKGIPGIGSTFVSIVEFLQKLLKAPQKEVQ